MAPRSGTTWSSTLTEHNLVTSFPRGRASFLWYPKIAFVVKCDLLTLHNRSSCRQVAYPKTIWKVSVVSQAIWRTRVIDHLHASQGGCNTRIRGAINHHSMRKEFAKGRLMVRRDHRSLREEHTSVEAYRSIWRDKLRSYIPRAPTTCNCCL